MQRVVALIVVLLAAGFANASNATERPAFVTLDLASTFPGSMPILGDAAHKLAAESAKNPSFRRVHDSYAAFSEDYAAWKYLSVLE